MPSPTRKKRRSKESKPTLFESWAHAQGVERPFHVLAKIEREEREQIAEHLGLALDGAWDKGIEIARHDLRTNRRPPAISRKSLRSQAEAVCIIGMDRQGIQARSHSMWRTLNPAADNHTWQQVLAGIVKEFKIKCHSRAIDVMEAVIFEHVAEEALARMSKDELDGIEELAKREPKLAEQLKKAGFGPSGRRLILAGIAKATLGQGFNAYIHAVKLAALANKKFGAKFVMANVTASLKIALRGLNVLLWAWLAADVLNLFFGSSRKRLLPVVAQIRTADLLQRME